MTDRSRRIINMVLAILVSVSAWIFVVYNYKPMTEVRYSSVPVRFTGEEALAERGLAVSEASDETISVVLSQRRVDSDDISEDDIEVKADVSDCTAGDNSVTIKVTGPDNTSVVSASEESIDISVGRIRTELMDIDVRYSEDAGEDEEPVALDLSRTEAEVSCTAERMKNITSIAAVLDRDDVSNEVKSYTVKLAALDEEGNEISHVVIDPDEISLDACEGYTKTVDLSVPVRNPKDDYYERSCSVPETVTIKGPKAVVDSTVAVMGEEVDLSNYYEDQEIPVEYILPEGVYIADASKGQTIKITVKEKEQDKEETEGSEDTES